MKYWIYILTLLTFFSCQKKVIINYSGLICSKSVAKISMDERGNDRLSINYEIKKLKGCNQGDEFEDYEWVYYYNFDEKGLSTNLYNGVYALKDSFSMTFNNERYQVLCYLGESSKRGCISYVLYSSSLGVIEDVIACGHSRNNRDISFSFFKNEKQEQFNQLYEKYIIDVRRGFNK